MAKAQTVRSIEYQISALINRREKMVKEVMTKAEISACYAINGKIKKLEIKLKELKQFEFLAR